jgi:hypothetical protein
MKDKNGLDVGNAKLHQRRAEQFQQAPYFVPTGFV